jgi:hypothetical protein
VLRAVSAASLAGVCVCVRARVCVCACSVDSPSVLLRCWLCSLPLGKHVSGVAGDMGVWPLCCAQDHSRLQCAVCVGVCRRLVCALTCVWSTGVHVWPVL